MSQAVVVGNGESRRSVNLESYRSTHALIGCNGIHRDIKVDHLICCDRRMVAEAIVNPAPITIGKMRDKKPASGKPVSGLMVNEPPCDIASACKPATSFGVMWTSIESSPRPADCMWLARFCRLIAHL